MNETCNPVSPSDHEFQSLLIPTFFLTSASNILSYIKYITGIRNESKYIKDENWSQIEGWQCKYQKLYIEIHVCFSKKREERRENNNRMISFKSKITWKGKGIGIIVHIDFHLLKG